MSMVEILQLMFEFYFFLCIIFSSLIAVAFTMCGEQLEEAWENAVPPGSSVYETSIKYPNLTAFIFTLMFTLLWPSWLAGFIFSTPDRRN